MLAPPVVHAHPLPVADRRKTPRVTLVCPLLGRIPSLNLSVTMTESSETGFSIQSPCHLSIGAVYELRFIIGTNRQITMTARVVHSLRNGASTVPLFLVGFASE